MVHEFCNMLHYFVDDQTVFCEYSFMQEILKRVRAVEIKAVKVKPPVRPYLHETLAQAVSTIQEDRVETGEVVPIESIEEKWAMCGGVPYGTYKSISFELEFYKGKATKKYLHMTVWRHDSGRYEINSYVL